MCRDLPESKQLMLGEGRTSWTPTNKNKQEPTAKMPTINHPPHPSFLNFQWQDGRFPYLQLLLVYHPDRTCKELQGVGKAEKSFHTLSLQHINLLQTQLQCAARPRVPLLAVSPASSQAFTCLGTTPSVPLSNTPLKRLFCASIGR